MEQTNATTPTPAAPETPKPVAPDTATTSNPIQNPVEYWQSQAQKFERLLENTQKKLGDQEKLVGQLQETQTKIIQQEVADLKKQLTDEKSAMEQARLEAVRVKLLAEKGLPVEMAEFVTETNPDKIAEQVNRLVKLVPAKPVAVTTSLANPGAATPPVDLSWLPGHPTYKNTGFGEGRVIQIKKE